MTLNTEAAQQGLDAYVEATDSNDVDLNSQVINMIVDLCALARQEGLNYQTILNSVDPILDYEAR